MQAHIKIELARISCRPYVNAAIAFDGITSRAFSSLEDFASWTRHLGDTETRWLAMKGVQPDDELQRLPADFRLDACHVLKVPGCQGQRHLLILRRSV